MPAGRPPSLTPDLIRQIGDAVAAGLYKETASALRNIPRSTLHGWLKRGAIEKERLATDRRARPRKAEALFVELSDTIEKAIAAADTRDLAIVDKRAQGGFKLLTTITRTRTRPAVNEAGEVVKGTDGQPVMVLETITERRESEALPEWQAAAWKLERRNPREWGRKVIRDPIGRDGDPLIPLAAIRAVLAGTDDLTPAPWEELEDHGRVGIGGSAPVAGGQRMIAAGKASAPAPDLPEGDAPA